MNNGKNKDKATYIVQKFISSGKSHEFNLDPFDLIILYTIARFLDMPLNKCFGKQVTLAYDCHMSRNEFQRRSLKLYQAGIILRYLKGKLYHYELGSKVTGIQDEIESTYWVHDDHNKADKKAYMHPAGA